MGSAARGPWVTAGLSQLCPRHLAHVAMAESRSPLSAPGAAFGDLGSAQLSILPRLEELEWAPLPSAPATLSQQVRGSTDPEEKWYLLPGDLALRGGRRQAGGFQGPRGMWSPGARPRTLGNPRGRGEIGGLGDSYIQGAGRLPSPRTVSRAETLSAASRGADPLAGRETDSRAALGPPGTPWDRVATGAVRSHRRPGDTLTSSRCGLVRREELLKITGREVTEGESAGGPRASTNVDFLGLEEVLGLKNSQCFSRRSLGAERSPGPVRHRSRGRAASALPCAAQLFVPGAGDRDQQEGRALPLLEEESRVLSIWKHSRGPGHVGEG